MNKIVKMKFGSHLYGLNTENSDTDYKGIYLPDKNECFLNKIPKSINKSTGNNRTKNTKEDIDYEIYSLQYFIQLGLKGETVALDMIHCPDDSKILLFSSDIWREIRKNRSKFYTKKLKSFFGYAMRQAAKYGIKGSRLSACEEVLNFLIDKKNNGYEKIIEIWDILPLGEHISKNKEFYDVCGKKIQNTVKIDYVIPIIQKYYDQYGKRAELAKKNIGIDFKAVSHACRAGMQLESLYGNKDIYFPFSGYEKDFLMKVKEGKLDYTTEIAPELEKILERARILSKNSDLPESPDTEFWNNFIINCYN